MSRGRVALRVLAALGVLLTVGWLLGDALPLGPRQVRGLVPCAVLAVLVLVVSVWLLRDGSIRLRRNPDLLVPLGCLLFALWTIHRGIELAALGPTLHEDLWVLEVGKVVVDVTLYLLVMIAVYVAYAAWVTTLALRAVSSGSGAPPAEHPPLRCFLRTLAAMALGLVVLLGLLALVLALLASGGGGTQAMTLIAILAILWNFATAALLPTVLHSPEPLGKALKRGIALSWRHLHRWWLVVLAHLLLLGLVTYVDVTYHPEAGVRETKTDGAVTVTRRSRTVARQNLGVQAFWTGAYEARTRWYEAYMAALEVPTHPLVDRVLWILFSVLAILVKLTIIVRWREAEGS